MYVVAVAGPSNVSWVQQELGADEALDYSKQVGWVLTRVPVARPVARRSAAAATAVLSVPWAYYASSRKQPWPAYPHKPSRQCSSNMVVSVAGWLSFCHTIGPVSDCV